VCWPRRPAEVLNQLDSQAVATVVAGEVVFERG
jgi:hypothetical protein